MKTNRWILIAFVIFAASVLALSLAGCSSSGTSGSSATPGATGGSTSSGVTSGAKTIVENNYQFTPSSMNVQVGDKVTFSNKDSVPHHVFVGTTDLGEQQPGQDVSWTADKDGTFALRCSIHPSMTGQITVGTGGSTSSPPAGGTGTGSSSTAPPAGGSSGYGY